jgi:hypothetical protein
LAGDNEYRDVTQVSEGASDGARLKALYLFIAKRTDGAADRYSYERRVKTGSNNNSYNHYDCYDCYDYYYY